MTKKYICILSTLPSLIVGGIASLVQRLVIAHKNSAKGLGKDSIVSNSITVTVEAGLTMPMSSSV